MANNGIVFSNNKSVMHTSAGTYSVQGNQIVFTPNNNYTSPNGVHYTYSVIGNEINKLLGEPDNATLRNKIIDELTNNPVEQTHINKFVGFFPEHYAYFEPIVLANGDSSIIYDWMMNNKTYNDKRYINALMGSLNNTDNILTHERFLCDVIENSGIYDDASNLEIRLKILALQIYNINEFMNEFRGSYDYCLEYDEPENDIAIMTDAHAQLHERICDTFYDNLPTEYQLGILL